MCKCSRKSEPRLMGAIFTAGRIREKYLPETQGNAISHGQQLAAPLMSRHLIHVSKKAIASTALFPLCSKSLPPSTGENIYACYITLKIYISEN